MKYSVDEQECFGHYVREMPEHAEKAAELEAAGRLDPDGFRSYLKGLLSGLEELLDGLSHRPELKKEDVSGLAEETDRLLAESLREALKTWMVGKRKETLAKRSLDPLVQALRLSSLVLRRAGEEKAAARVLRAVYPLLDNAEKAPFAGPCAETGLYRFYDELDRELEGNCAELSDDPQRAFFFRADAARLSLAFQPNLRMGLYYWYGKNVKEDRSEALLWFERAGTSFAGSARANWEEGDFRTWIRKTHGVDLSGARMASDRTDRDFEDLFTALSPLLSAHFSLLFPEKEEREMRLVQYLRYRAAAYAKSGSLPFADPSDPLFSECKWLSRLLVSEYSVTDGDAPKLKFSGEWYLHWRDEGYFTEEELGLLFPGREELKHAVLGALEPAPQPLRVLLFLFSCFPRFDEHFLRQTGLGVDTLCSLVTGGMSVLYRNEGPLRKAGIDPDTMNPGRLLRTVWKNEEALHAEDGELFREDMALWPRIRGNFRKLGAVDVRVESTGVMGLWDEILPSRDPRSGIDSERPVIKPEKGSGFLHRLFGG